MKIFEKYKFTKKIHPLKGIMSAILGSISIISVILAICLPYWKQAQVTLSNGLTCLLGLIMSVIGLILSIICFWQRDVYPLFPLIGALLNGIVILLCGLILYLGAYGV